MVSTRRASVGGQTTITAATAVAENKINNNIETKKDAGKTAREETTGSPCPDYEQIRQQRIRENLEKMQKLGLFKVSAALKPKSGRGRPRRNPLVPSSPPKHKPRPVGRPRKTLTNGSSPIPINKPQNRFLPQRQRCSSRLKGLTPVNYSDVPDKGDNNMEVGWEY